MTTKCPKCNVPVQINEKAYSGIVNLDYVCPVCGNRFTIQLNNQLGGQTRQPVQPDATTPNYQQLPYHKQQRNAVTKEVLVTNY